MDTSTAAGSALVASADVLATDVGAEVLAAGGNAVDAAVATAAAMAVVAPHLCGMGGDLFALVAHDGIVEALDASGAAPAAASAAVLRDAGLTEMPFRSDVRSVTVPGCVDGWVALHRRFGSLPIGHVLAGAISLAEGGFRASPLLVGGVQRLDAAGRAELAVFAEQAASGTVRWPGAGRALADIATGGRDGFYAGEFGEGLQRRWPQWFTAADLAQPQARWVEPLRAEVWGVELWTTPPPSQGYLLLGAALLAGSAGLADDPDDPRWAHVLIECATAAGHDRPLRLHDGANGAALIEEIGRRTIDLERASDRRLAGGSGDTTYLCTADRHGMAVSLIQSNASGFGSWLAEPSTGINLQNRGVGFSLRPGHPAEIGPGRRPPHTLCPALATQHGAVRAVLGTMGGDAQPQILLQLAARLLHHEQRVGEAIAAGRWALRGPRTGFDTWTEPDPPVAIEGQAPAAWDGDLTRRGHRVVRDGAFSSAFGHAHAVVREHGVDWSAAADPRTVVGAARAL